MPSQDIRLRLVIRRHGVPEVRLVWPCACSEDMTVSRLLELVNDVVTLESGEWGLEDYAVELADGNGGSFECLHFQQVGRILKDEDQVLIRSLLTGDLKRRRLNGRHQVSADGKHLVDGIAFGRPWLRTPRDRPQIELPPRKRARIALDSEPDDEEQHEQLLLEAPDASYHSNAKRLRFSARFEDDDDDDDSEAEGCDDDCCHKDEDDDHDYEESGDEDDLEDDEAEDDDFFEDDQVDDQIDDQIDDAAGEDQVEDDDMDEHDKNLRFLGQDPVDNDDGDFSEQQVDASESEGDDEDADDDTIQAEDLEEEIRLLKEENAIVEEDPAFKSWEDGNAEENPVGVDDQDEDDDEIEGEKLNLEDEIRLMQKDAAALQAVGGLPWEMYCDDLQILEATFHSASQLDIELGFWRAGRDLKLAYSSLKKLHGTWWSVEGMMEQRRELLLLADGVRPRVVEPRQRARPLIEEVEDIEEPAPKDAVSSPTTNLGGNQHATASATPNVEESDTSSSSSSESEEESSSEDDSEDDASDDSEDESQPEVQATEPGTLKDKSGASSSETSSSDDTDGNDSDSSESDSESDDDGHGVPLIEPSGCSSHNISDASESDSLDESDSDSDSASDSASESGSESGSESEPESEKTSSKPVVRSSVLGQIGSASSQQKGKSDAIEALGKQPGAPGHGLSRTQRRNARRRRNKHLRQLQSVEPESASENGTDVTGHLELLARKKALLAVFSESKSVGDDVGKGDQRPKEPTAAAPAEDLRAQNQETPGEEPQEGSPGTTEEATKRRNRFDLGAGRRLLFGALGLKAPKSKADEESIRKSLMKDVRPLSNPRIQEADSGSGHGTQSNAEAAAREEDDEDPDSWRDKITYRAVECCHDDMVLSEPPFPFVQRWDPQQKYDNMRKRKRASENYHAETSFAGDESYYYYDDQEQVEQEARRKKKKNKNKKNKKGKPTETADQSDERANDGDDVILNYDETPIKSSQFTDLDDLPSLPHDPDGLPMLAPGTAKPGMVITWKQLLMSKATKWQPEVVSVTGLVIPGGDDNTLHVVLAKRDREKNEKVYDEETGQRIYDKFEVPDVDEAGEGEEEEQEDSGFRTMQWGDMVEPRLLQREPTADAMSTPVKANGTTWEEDEERRWNDEQGEAEVSDFHTLEECLANQLSTEQVRAAVEEGLMQSICKDTPEIPESVSIQSGQQMPRLEPSTSGDEVQVSTTDDSWEMLKQKSNETSKTLEAQSEEASDGIGSPEELQSRDASESVQEEGETAADQEAESASCLADAAVDVDVDMAMADGSSLVIPSSSQTSVGSGRQPQGDGDAEDVPDAAHEDSQEDDSVIPETLPQLRETTPTSDKAKEQGTPSNNSSPFPSIEEIFMSATQTRSPSKKRQGSVKAERKAGPRRDLEYEEAMRRLDEGHESEQSPGRDEGVVNLFPNATQPPPASVSASVGRTKEESPFVRAGFTKAEKRTTTDKSPFVIPQGSQVIELSSSDEEDGPSNMDGAADDRRGSLPTGPGWVRKSSAATAMPLISAVSKYKGANRGMRRRGGGRWR